MKPKTESLVSLANTKLQKDAERPKCGCEPKKEKEGLNALFPDLSSVSSTRKNRWVGFPQSGVSFFLIGDHEYGIA